MRGPRPAGRTTARSLIVSTAVLALNVAILPATAATEAPPSPPPLLGDDVTAQIVDAPSGPAASWTPALEAGSGDPLGLVPKAAFQRRYTLDTDVIEVWRCGSVGRSHTSIIASLSGNVTPYYATISDGVYDVTFVAGGDVPGPAGDCVDQVAAASTANPEGVLIVDAWTNGGYASPGFVCSVGDCAWMPATYPDNGRYVVVGTGVLDAYPFVAVHEVGHSIHWPHSNAGLGNEYDNPIDVMSGNEANSDPYHTLAYNRYQAGWIDAADVVVYDGSAIEVDLKPHHLDGTQMIVIPTGTTGVFYTLDARVQTPDDPIPSSWDGVEVYLVDQATCPGWGGPSPCPSIWRDHLMEPPAPFTVGHVLGVGERVTLADVPITVTGRSGDTFTLALGLEPGTFGDTAGHLFAADIAWLANEGITRGCNPPANTLFCPDDRVTRGQMAAFLARAMGYTADGGGDLFVDDDTSIFEADIDRLATAGVTEGCNPPANDRFCPTDHVTRGQMAAFLTRAMDYTADGGGDLFVDDDTSVFEADIDKLATAGVTAGCNPPANDRFCPDAYVTRGQLAAFLHRALG
jgi:hypothetical protein